MTAVVAEIPIAAALQRHDFEVARFHTIRATNVFCLAKHAQGSTPLSLDQGAAAPIAMPFSFFPRPLHAEPFRALREPD